MEVLEIAKQLGEAIKNDERCRRVQIAKALNDTDVKLQGMIGEFNLKKIAMNAEFNKEEPNKDKLKELENEMKDLYQKIMENKHMAEYNTAKKELDELISHINSIIQMSVEGEISEGGCSGNCSGCQGCH